MESRVILYDGDCGLCNQVIRYIMKHAKKGTFSFVPLQSSEANEIGKNCRIGDINPDSVVYITGKKSYTRSAAVLRILRDMGGFISTLYIFIIIPGFIRDALYRFVARNRKLF